MRSYILAHFRNRTVFNAKFMHGTEYLGSRHFKISLGALISKYQRGFVNLYHLVFLIGITAIHLDSLYLLNKAIECQYIYIFLIAKNLHDSKNSRIFAAKDRNRRKDYGKQ